MKIKTVKTQYGFINFAEVGGIDMGKDKSHTKEFNPKFCAYQKNIGHDSRIENLKSLTDLDEHEKEEYSWFYNSVFSFPLKEVNEDWHIINRDFTKTENDPHCNSEYLNRMIKAKTCPIVIDNETFMAWFVKVYPYLNDTWKSENVEYMEIMDKRILDNNMGLLEAFKNQDMKSIRTNIRLSADINFERDGKSPLRYAVDYENIDLVKYLINKKVVVPTDLELQDKNHVTPILQKYMTSSSKKIKFKL